MPSAVFVQTNGFGSWFQLLVHSRTSFSRARTLRWTPRRMSWSVSSPNQRSTWLIHDEPVGVKCRWKRGGGPARSGSPGLVGGQVVADQVHAQVGRHGFVDGDEELAELDRPVLAVQRGDDAAVGDVERGEQAGGAVADVVGVCRCGIPGIIGSTGWERSRACMPAFSSAHNTTAASGGSEARWLRFVPRALPAAFSYLPGQSGYNKRLRNALPLTTIAGPATN